MFKPYVIIVSATALFTAATVACSAASHGDESGDAGSTPLRAGLDAHTVDRACAVDDDCELASSFQPSAKPGECSLPCCEAVGVSHAGARRIAEARRDACTSFTVCTMECAMQRAACVRGTCENSPPGVDAGSSDGG